MLVGARDPGLFMTHFVFYQALQTASTQFVSRILERFSWTHGAMQAANLTSHTGLTRFLTPPCKVYGVVYGVIYNALARSPDRIREEEKFHRACNRQLVQGANAGIAAEVFCVSSCFREAN